MRIVHTRSLSEAQFAAALRLQQRLDRARDPGLPVTPAAELRAFFSHDATDYARHHRMAAFDSRCAAVAIGHLELTRDPANATLAVVEVTPADDDTAAAVLAELLRIARADGRSSVLARDDRTPARHEFWTALGAELRYAEQESELPMDAVDGALMRRWIIAAPSDMSLIGIAGRCPDKWIDALTVTANAMNDAPTDDLDIADATIGSDDLIAEIGARAALGLEYRGILAVDGNDAAVGATEVYVNRHRPGYSWQWSTVVLAEHRGRGVGRWLKAAMWRSLRADEPEVTLLRTGNASSNAAMLAINARMGYKPVHRTAAWQGDLAVIESRLRA